MKMSIKILFLQSQALQPTKINGRETVHDKNVKIDSCQKRLVYSIYSNIFLLQKMAAVSLRLNMIDFIMLCKHNIPLVFPDLN